MKPTILATLMTLTLAAPLHANPVDDIVKQHEQELVTTFKDIHQHPELGFMETRTSGIVAKKLKALGYRVITGLGKTGVVGILENGKGPVVMYRADMDANSVKEITELPYASKAIVKKPDGTEVPVMHACGHDAHTTWLLGVAEVMAKLKDQWKGTLVLVAQPAEELIEGAHAMVKDGMYDKGVPLPDYLFGMHTMPAPTGYIAVAEGAREAGTDQIDVVFHGIGGHGSSPENTRDPVLMAASAIVQYQFIVSRAIPALDAAVLTVGSVQAGSDNNVIPDQALLKLNLRWYKEKDRKTMIDAIKRIDDAIAMAYGLPKSLYPTMKMKGYAQPLVNDPKLTKVVRTALMRVVDEKKLVTELPRVMGSEDFQHLALDDKRAKDTPYVYAFVGIADPKLAATAQKEGKAAPFFNHNGNFQVDLNAIPLGVEAASNALLDIFKLPSIRH